MIVRLFCVSACLAVLMSNSALAEQPAGVQSRPVLDGRGGILETTRGQFTFNPVACGVFVEDGINDIEIHGPGTGPNGEVIYFEFSSTGSHMTVSFNVSSVFESAEKQFVAQDFSEEVSGTLIFVDDLNLYDQDQEVVGPAKLAIDCRPA